MHRLAAFCRWLAYHLETPKPPPVQPADIHYYGDDELADQRSVAKEGEW